MRINPLNNLRLLATLAISFTSSVSFAVDPAALEALKGETITIAIADEPFPPYHYIAGDGRLAGFDPEIAEALCKRMRVECRLIPVRFRDLFSHLADRKFDAIVSALQITEEREKFVDFTTPYVQQPFALLALMGSDMKATPDAMRGRTIGFERICPEWDDTSPYLRDRFDENVSIKPYDAIASCPSNGVVPFDQYKPTTETQLRDLKDGRIDAIFGDKLVLHLITSVEPFAGHYAFMEPDLYTPASPLGIAVGEGQSKLRAAFNAAILALRSDGDYRAIAARHFPIEMGDAP